MAKNGDFNKISNFDKKNGDVTFEPLWLPNFMPSYRKILGAVKTEQRVCNRSTNVQTNKPDHIDPRISSRVNNRYMH